MVTNDVTSGISHRFMLFVCLLDDCIALPTSICLFSVEENSSPLLKQQLPKLERFRDSWLDVTTHSETQTLFCTDSRSTSLGVAETGTLRLDLRALKSQKTFFFLRIPFYTVQRYHNYKNPVGRIDTLRRGYTRRLISRRLTLPFCQYLGHVSSDAKSLCLFH